MSLPTAVRTTLLANPALTALTGDRVFYLRFQQDNTQPAVVFRPLGDVNELTHGGVSVLLEPELRLTLRAERLSQIETMRSAIIDQFIVPEFAMAEYGVGNALINDLGAEYDDQLNVYHHYLTLNLQLRTS